MIVHINGMPGVGKLTVAKLLAEILPARLIDNHLILDLVTATCSRESPQYFPMINELLSVVHHTLMNGHEDENVIFTNALAKGRPEQEAIVEQARVLAAAIGTPFVPVLISCSAEVNASRLSDPDRRNKGKLMDETVLADLLARVEIAHPSDHRHALKIDTTHLSPTEAANRIAEHIRQCLTAEPQTG